MSIADDKCGICGWRDGAHTDYCPIATQDLASVPAPKSTAYDRDRQSIADRLFKLESQHSELLRRLNGALQRIEAREAVEARASAQCSPPWQDEHPNAFRRYFGVAFAAICIDQVMRIQAVHGWYPWAHLLDKYDVARWMHDHPDHCRGAFNLCVLEKSIDPEVRAEWEASKRQARDANGSPLPDEGT